MSSRREAENLVEQVAFPIAKTQGVSVVDVEFVREHGRRYLRVCVDKPGGVTLDDCGAFSRELGARLDALDLISESFYLEVASPGLDRPLKKDRDFELFRGRRVIIRTFAPPEGAGPGRNQLTGELFGLTDGIVELRDDEGRVWRVPREQVACARLDPGL